MKTLMGKLRRAAQRDLLCNPPRFRNRDSHMKAAIILAELSLIHKSSHLSGKVKQDLFERGAKQLDDLYHNENPQPILPVISS